jgi:hypothetical protein
LLRHAAAVCWLSTSAIFRHPSILRNLIWPLATRLKSRISAASSLGREPASSRGGEILRGAVQSCSQRKRDGAGGSRERPLSHAIAVASSDVTALVGIRPQHGPQLFVDGRLDRGADLLVNQFAERDGLKLMPPTGLLIPFRMARSSGGRPGRRRVGRALHQPEECATSLFHQTRDTTSGVGCIGELATPCPWVLWASSSVAIRSHSWTASGNDFLLAPSNG